MPTALATHPTSKAHGFPNDRCRIAPAQRPYTFFSAFRRCDTSLVASTVALVGNWAKMGLLLRNDIVGNSHENCDQRPRHWASRFSRVRRRVVGRLRAPEKNGGGRRQTALQNSRRRPRFNRAVRHCNRHAQSRRLSQRGNTSVGHCERTNGRFQRPCKARAGVIKNRSNVATSVGEANSRFAQCSASATHACRKQLQPQRETSRTRLHFRRDA